MAITLIAAADWADILAIQAHCYPQIEPESLDVLQSKWRNLPAVNFVYWLEGAPCAYLLAHAWYQATPPKLYQTLPAKCDGKILLLHDLAVARRAAGLGIGKALVKHLISVASSMHFSEIRLVSLQPAIGFWLKSGFEPVTDITPGAEYGAGAMVMLRSLRA